MENIEKFINEHIELLPSDGLVQQSVAEMRAFQFLKAVAKLADWKHQLANQKIKATSVLSVVSNDTMNKVEAKTITEKKSVAEATPSYIAAREELELLDSQLSYIKAMMDVFNSAHFMYKQIASGAE